MLCFLCAFPDSRRYPICYCTLLNGVPFVSRDGSRLNVDVRQTPSPRRRSVASTPIRDVETVKLMEQSTSSSDTSIWDDLRLPQQRLPESNQSRSRLTITCTRSHSDPSIGASRNRLLKRRFSERLTNLHQSSIDDRRPFHKSPCHITQPISMISLVSIKSTSLSVDESPSSLFTSSNVKPKRQIRERAEQRFRQRKQLHDDDDSDSDPEHQAKDRFRLPVIEKRQLFGIRSMTADFLQETRAITSDGEESLSDVSMPSSPDDDPLKRTIVPRQSSIFKASSPIAEGKRSSSSESGSFSIPEELPVAQIEDAGKGEEIESPILSPPSSDEAKSLCSPSRLAAILHLSMNGVTTSEQQVIEMRHPSDDSAGLSTISESHRERCAMYAGASSSGDSSSSDAEVAYRDQEGLLNFPKAKFAPRFSTTDSDDEVLKEKAKKANVENAIEDAVEVAAKFVPSSSRSPFVDLSPTNEILPEIGDQERICTNENTEAMKHFVVERLSLDSFNMDDTRRSNSVEDEKSVEDMQDVKVNEDEEMFSDDPQMFHKISYVEEMENFAGKRQSLGFDDEDESPPVLQFSNGIFNEELARESEDECIERHCDTMDNWMGEKSVQRASMYECDDGENLWNEDHQTLRPDQREAFASTFDSLVGRNRDISSGDITYNFLEDKDNENDGTSMNSVDKKEEEQMIYPLNRTLIHIPDEITHSRNAKPSSEVRDAIDYEMNLETAVFSSSDDDEQQVQRGKTGTRALRMKEFASPDASNTKHEQEDAQPTSALHMPTLSEFDLLLRKFEREQKREIEERERAVADVEMERDFEQYTTSIRLPDVCIDQEDLIDFDEHPVELEVPRHEESSSISPESTEVAPLQTEDNQKDSGIGGGRSSGGDMLSDESSDEGRQKYGMKENRRRIARKMEEEKEMNHEDKDVKDQFALSHQRFILQTCDDLNQDGEQMDSDAMSDDEEIEELARTSIEEADCRCKIDDQSGRNSEIATPSNSRCSCENREEGNVGEAPRKRNVVIAFGNSCVVHLRQLSESESEMIEVKEAEDEQTVGEYVRGRDGRVTIDDLLSNNDDREGPATRSSNDTNMNIDHEMTIKVNDVNKIKEDDDAAHQEQQGSVWLKYEKTDQFGNRTVVIERVGRRDYHPIATTAPQALSSQPPSTMHSHIQVFLDPDEAFSRSASSISFDMSDTSTHGERQFDNVIEQLDEIIAHSSPANFEPRRLAISPSPQTSATSSSINSANASPKRSWTSAISAGQREEEEQVLRMTTFDVTAPEIAMATSEEKRISGRRLPNLRALTDETISFGSSLESVDLPPLPYSSRFQVHVSHDVKPMMYAPIIELNSATPPPDSFDLSDGDDDDDVLLPTVDIPNLYLTSHSPSSEGDQRSHSASTGRKSVSWNEQLELGPEPHGDNTNTNCASPSKPILKTPAPVSGSSPRNPESSSNYDNASDGLRKNSRQSPLSTLPSMQTVLRYATSRLFKDLRMLVHERDRIIEALTNATADERGSGDSGISVASHRHQQRFCDKLLESKIELDVRIDSIWTKLTSSQEMSELQPLSPGQISWLFSVHCSTQLTFRRQQHEPPPRSLRRQIQDSVSQRKLPMAFAGDYQLRLAKLRRAFIGASREDSETMLEASNVIEDARMLGEFNRLADQLVTRESRRREEVSLPSDLAAIEEEMRRMKITLARVSKRY